jgi:Na+/H+ antiporter NhaD/arsenite permease-like protein
MSRLPEGALLGLPFLGLLLSIALLPGLAPRFWLRRMGWVSLGWSLVLLAFIVGDRGVAIAWQLGWHALIAEYMPFVTMLGALYVVAGGVQIRGGPPGTPLGNTLTLVLGMALGLVMGPTGAAVVLIQPLLAANAHRRRRVHLVLFLIILVANISGALTPLGNPPLFAGLLRGVPFFWPARSLLLPYLTLTGVLLTAFYAIDRYLVAAEPPARRGSIPRVQGWRNLGLTAVLGASVMLQTLDLGTLTLFGEPVGAGRLGGSFLAIGIGWLSWRITPRARRRANDFTWHPMTEVAVLFAGIFVTLAPVSHLLQAGSIQALLPSLQGSDGQPPALAYFWLAGLLSAFLDNAPTYLVFFDMARINPTDPGPVLVAISAGAVFFGGLTYIGNAPNLMLRGIASHRGVRMPAFGLYLAMAAALLLPAFVLLGAIFFR